VAQPSAVSSLKRECQVFVRKTGPGRATLRSPVRSRNKQRWGQVGWGSRVFSLSSSSYTRHSHQHDMLPRPEYHGEDCIDTRTLPEMHISYHWVGDDEAPGGYDPISTWSSRSRRTRRQVIPDPRWYNSYQVASTRNFRVLIRFLCGHLLRISNSEARDELADRDSHDLLLEGDPGSDRTSSDLPLTLNPSHASPVIIFCSSLRDGVGQGQSAGGGSCSWRYTFGSPFGRWGRRLGSL